MDLMGGIVVWGGVALASGAAGGLLAGVKNRDYSFVDRLVLRAAAAGLHPAAAAPLSGPAPAPAAPRRERRARLLSSR